MREVALLKEELGDRARVIIAEGLNLGLDRTGKKALCPFHPDKKPSFTWFEKGLMWRCHACNKQVDIYTFLQEKRGMTFNEAVEFVKELLGKAKPIKADVKEFDKPNIKTRPLSEKFIEYMEKRKLKKETLEAWKVVEGTWQNRPVYVFQYFDENNELVYVTYRGYGKGGSGIKGGCEPNTKSILWGMWQIDKEKPVVITEGQIDAMCVWQSGYKNVVSVPSGANNFQWIDNCWDWLQDIEEFIVFADNDMPGLKMADTLKRRLKNVKMITHPKYKDANEVMYHEGEESLLKMIEDAINAMPQGVLDMADMEYKSALEVQEETIETGFYEYDAHVEDWKMGELTVIFGRNGEGKTTFISQIIAHCLDRGVKVFLYSGEMSNQKIQDWMYRQLIGNQRQFYRKVKAKYREKWEPKPDVIKRIKDWQRGKLFLYDRTQDGKLDKFFEVMETVARRYGVKLFVIDNLMAILEENAESLLSDQANFVQRCKDFAVINHVHVVLLTHPNKNKPELENATVGNLDKFDISGTGNIPNKADNIIAVERNWGDDRPCDAIITSLKDRETGQRKCMQFYFSQDTLRFYNDKTPEERHYGWQESEVQGFFDMGEISKDNPFV